ncbi:MAG: copper homeostasis protein CutC [Flavobacteriales bacterium]
MRVAVEVCVTSVEEAMVAEQCGVDTIEVCNWLACGGVTPSFGLLNVLQERTVVRKRVLVRPTPGGFHYTADERQTLLRDVLMSGVGDEHCGIVTGGLDADDMPDAELVRGTLLGAGDREVTFHRAIEFAMDMGAALDRCMQLGVHRVLTSGGGTLAMDSAEALASLVKRAGDQLIVAAAGGVNAGNVVELVERTGVREVHFSAQRPRLVVVKGHALGSGGGEANFSTEPDVARIEGVLMALAKAGLR